jgi:hypothetical protein
MSFNASKPWSLADVVVTSLLLVSSPSDRSWICLSADSVMSGNCGRDQGKAVLLQVKNDLVSFIAEASQKSELQTLLVAQARARKTQNCDCDCEKWDEFLAAKDLPRCVKQLGIVLPSTP